ncbi:hypothetical protein E1B22_01120 [Thermaerobacter sp. FW80]|uniref:hypothetical protein n=1 Tax=Thermaerobacter sp. FW80 TaxID=2546351 RepID=UPI001074CC45|nr:hypothetical protein [Thermaerobacter sp. FW80]QBS36703.1 hypothetical protein E1B22_01120 [Thermaerobacter sp. FW80]
MVFAVSVLALSHRMAPATARRWGWAAVGALFAFALISIFSIGRYVMLLTLAAVAAMAAREAGRAAGSRLLAVLAAMWVAVSLGLVTVVPAMAGVQELVLEFALALLAYRWAVRPGASRVG